MYIDFRTFFTRLHHDVPVLIILFVVIVMNYHDTPVVVTVTCTSHYCSLTDVNPKQHMFVMKSKNVDEIKILCLCYHVL